MANIVCSYCQNRSKSNKFDVLDDALYALFREHKVYERNAYFCSVCIERGRHKLERREHYVDRLASKNASLGSSLSTFETIVDIREKLKRRREESSSMSLPLSDGK